MLCRRILSTLVFFLLISTSAFAQFYPTRYRPPNQNWQQLTTDHFTILFPQGSDSVAWHTGRILEHEYPKIQQLTGGELNNFPIILSGYNDRSNGLVTSLHFRSEIDISPIKGKVLNPETGGWLQNVVPHELVHALHLSNMDGMGLGQLVNIFSPDLARSMHGASPSGVREGLATYYESESLVDGGGRGNYPYFSNQFDAVFNSPKRWSMGQMIHFPERTRPFNRHYIGGYEFTKWLQDTYGEDISRDAIDFNIRWPFLGYGLALKHATGQWPAQLYNEFEEATEKQLNEKKNFADSYMPLPVSFHGSEIRRPKWLSDSTLIFHGSFYNARPGFYRYDLNSRSLHRILSTGSIGDFNYTLSPDKETFIYSYNEPDLIYPNAFKATLVKASAENGKRKKIVDARRLFAPSFGLNSNIYALQTHETYFELSQYDLTNQSVINLFSHPDYQLDAVEAYSQNSKQLAVIANHRGTQGLWLTTVGNIENDLLASPDISFEEGSVFDPAWHPSGKRLLFSADFSGTLQVYEYELQSGSITQVTNAGYNAFEPSYSPGDNRISFIIQKGNQKLPVVIERENFYGEVIQSPEASYTSGQPALDLSGTEPSSWTFQSYRTGVSWLKPRSVLPEVEEVSGADIYEYGFGLYSSDLLQQQSYSLTLSTAQERLWYDLTYQNKQFFPGFKARIYSQPAIRRFQFQTDEESFNQSFLRQERSFALSLPMQFTFHQNVKFTGLFIEPEVRQSQIRYFNLNGDKASDFSNTTIGNIFAQFNYQLQQNIRDVQPNSGLILYSEVEHYLKAGSLTLETSQGDAGLHFTRPTAFRGGIFGYISPLRRWNQSLRIGFEGITQTAPLFDNQSVVSDGFKNDVLPFANNILSLKTRYTVPLFYPDDGGFLVPLYLSNIYLAGFSDTVVDATANDWINNSRTVIGGGIRAQFRISNLSFDIGIGIGVEPSRGKTHYFIGNF